MTDTNLFDKGVLTEEKLTSLEPKSLGNRGMKIKPKNIKPTTPKIKNIAELSSQSQSKKSKAVRNRDQKTIE